MSAIAVLVTVEIEEARIPKFLEVMKIDVEGSREEEGCLKFDLLRHADAPNKFVFYEVYKDADAQAFHREQPHYKAWADFKKEGGVISQSVIKTDGLMV